MKVVQILKDGSMNEIDFKKINFKNCCKLFLGNTKSQGNNDMKELSINITTETICDLKLTNFFENYGFC